MTVSTTLNKVIYSGNGSTTAFSFSFPGVATTDIRVFITDNLGNIAELTNGVNFSVTLNAPVAPNPTGVGGSVNYPLSGSPLPTGWFLTILRTLTQSQAVSLANQGTIYPATIESMCDYITMLCQQITELQNRAISVQPSDAIPPPLPTAVARANMTMGFDANGNPTAVAGPVGNVNVSAALQPFVTNATLAGARAVLGVGSANQGLTLGGATGAGFLDVVFPMVNLFVSTPLSNLNGMAQFICNNTLTITLPKSTTLWSGFSIWIHTRGHTITLTPDAADSINGGASGASYVLPNNAVSNRFMASSDAVSNWYV